MKNLKAILGLAMMALFIFSSCTKEESVKIETTPIPSFKKELKVYDSTGENYVVFEIYNEDYGHLTSEEITITAENIEIPIEEENTQTTSFIKEEDNQSLPDFYVKEVKLQDKFNSLKFDFGNVKTNSMLRGKSDWNIDYPGRCGNIVSGRRVCGFRGWPDNCDHTDWEWKYSNGGWNKVYDVDSFWSTDYIAYYSTYLNAYKYRLRNDPNSNCNSYPSWSIYYTSLGC